MKNKFLREVENLIFECVKELQRSGKLPATQRFDNDRRK